MDRHAPPEVKTMQRQADPQRSGVNERRADAQVSDNRPEAVAQRQMQAALDQRPQVVQQKALHAAINQRANQTGLPDGLKAGVESLSGMSMDHVKVHYNSAKPAQLNAHAYAQGSDIHLAPGQARHLPHEAWHVVQQAQGRVKPTMQMKSGVAVNDNQGLEHEADVMGGRALLTAPPLSGQQGLIAHGKGPTGAPLQLASAYNGVAIAAASGAWGGFNLPVNDQFVYGGANAQNTATSAHADRIDGDWSGRPVASVPVDWAKFTQLVGPYAVNNLVQGHMVNQNIGGKGDGENLAPLTSSANTRHWVSVEQPIVNWLGASPQHVIDYKVTPVYGVAPATLKNKLIDEFKLNHAEGTSDTGPNLRAWVDNYIDQTISSRLDIEVSFQQLRNDGAKVRTKPAIVGQVANTLVSAYGGGLVSAYKGAFGPWNLNPVNTITNGGLAVNNTGVSGYAKRIDYTHNGTAVGAQPTDWEKFLRLVGPEAVSGFVQGHLINQRMGGLGIANNLTPLTSSANAVHYQKVESAIIAWLASQNSAQGYEPLVNYKVTPQYGGADAGLKNALLNAFDNANKEIRANTGPNLIVWLGNYIDATFPARLDVDVYFMEANGFIPHHATRARSKPLLQGNVTNEPA